MQLGSTTELVQLEDALLQLTFDQLRTVVVLGKKKSALRAATELGRDQSSVQKQLETLNKRFEQLCGEAVARPTRRGRDLEFTRTGEWLIALADSLLAEWHAELQAHRLHLGNTIAVGATPFILDFLPKAWNRMVRTLERDGVELSVRHVHTSEVRRALEDKSLDLVLGGVLLDRGSETIESDEYDFLPWNRQPFVVLSNYPRSEFPGPKATPEDLRKLTLLRPENGIIHEFMIRWYGAEYERRLDVFPVSGDVLFKLSLLRSNSVRAWIPVPEYLVKSPERYGRGLIKLPLHAPDFPDLHVVAGVLMRRHDRGALSEQHPLNVIWKLFEDEARTSMPRGRRP